MGFNLHAQGTNDPDDVRNWRIHMVAIIASMSAVASKSPSTLSAATFTSSPPRIVSNDPTPSGV